HGERGAEDEPLRAADDRPLIDEFTEAGGERQRRERSGARRASVADIEALDLPSAADRVGETERQEPAALPLRGERRGQTRQAYHHCDHGPTTVRSPRRKFVQRAARTGLCR